MKKGDKVVKSDKYNATELDSFYMLSLSVLFGLTPNTAKQLYQLGRTSEKSHNFFEKLYEKKCKYDNFERDMNIVRDRVNGMRYRELSAKYNITISSIQMVLSKTEESFAEIRGLHKLRVYTSITSEMAELFECGMALQKKNNENESSLSEDNLETI